MLTEQQLIHAYNIDIVMCIDVTGSMDPIINKVKACALNFNDYVRNEMSNAGGMINQLRVKVIAFGDYAFDENPMNESAFFTLPEQNEEFSFFVTKLKASGGGDIEENGLEAIVKAIQSDWVVTGLKKRHIIMLFTDAPALALKERKNDFNYPKDVPNDLQELCDWFEGRIKIGSFTPAVCSRLIMYAPNVTPWDEMSSWKYTSHIITGLSDGCDDIDFKDTVKHIFSAM